MKNLSSKAISLIICSLPKPEAFKDKKYFVEKIYRNKQYFL